MNVRARLEITLVHNDVTVQHVSQYIYIYSVIHRQTVSFYQNSSVWLDTQDPRSWDRNPSNFTLDCVSDHSSTKQTTLAKRILRYFFIFRNSSSSFCLHFLYPIGHQSAQFFRRALHYASGGRQFLHQRAQPPWGRIYCHPQTDCFVLSELFSVAKHAGRSKPGSKPVQLYLRLCFRPLVHQADHVG